MTNAEKQHTLADLERQSMAYQEVLSIADLPREVKLRSLLEEGKKVKWRNQTNLKEFDLTILETGNPTDEHIDFLYELLFRPKKFDPSSNKHIAMREEILENLPDVYTKSDLENAANIEGLYYDHVHAGDIKNNQGLGSIDQKVSGSVTIDTITPKGPEVSGIDDILKSDFEVISGESKKGKEISEKLGITAKPGYPVTESGKPDLKLVKASTADEKFRAKLKAKLMALPEFKDSKMTQADMDFVLKDVRADLGMDGSYATVMKNAERLEEKRKKANMDEAWNEATKDFPQSGSIDDMKKWVKDKETKSLVKTTKKKDRPSIRLMKNFEKELDDIELAEEGYNLQEIGIIKRAREVMKKENQNPNDALAWVRSEMADEAGIEFEEFMKDFDWGDFPGDTMIWLQGGQSWTSSRFFKTSKRRMITRLMKKKEILHEIFRVVGEIGRGLVIHVRECDKSFGQSKNGIHSKNEMILKRWHERTFYVWRKAYIHLIILAKVNLEGRTKTNA